MQGTTDEAYKDEETLRELYHDRGMSMPEVAEELDATRNKVQYWMNKHGIERRSTSEAVKVKQLSIPPKLLVDKNGREYFYVMADGERQTFKHHRLLATLKYSLGEMRGMDVHHVNGVPWDNRLENYVLMDRSDHVKHHWEEGHYDDRGQ